MNKFKESLNYFYNYINRINFKNIDDEKLNQLFKEIEKYKKYSLTKRYFNTKKDKIIEIINIIKFRSYKVNDDRKVESAILFILLVDPTFEATKIYGESNTIEEIQEKMKNFFGYFDKNLIKLESLYIKKFLSQEKKKEIEDEIEERIYK